MQSAKGNPDPGVGVVVRALDLLEWIVLYEILWTIPWVRSKKVRKKFAYVYVLVWAALLGAILATSDSWTGSGGWVWLFVAIPAYRLLDIFRWWADLLLDKRHFNLVSAQRSLIFAAFNLGEVALVAAIWLRASGQAKTAGNAGFQGFQLVSQLNPPTAGTTWAEIAVVLAEGTALLLLLGGIATVIGLVPEKLHESGKHKSYSKWAELFAAKKRRQRQGQTR